MILKALDFRQPNLVLFERKRKNCVETMNLATADWCLLYQDSLAQLWGRRSVYDDPMSADYLPVTEREIGNSPQQGSVAWPAFPVLKPRVTRVAVNR